MIDKLFRSFRKETPAKSEVAVYENREIIDRLCVAFAEDLKKYPLFVDKVEFQNIEPHG